MTKPDTDLRRLARTDAWLTVVQFLSEAADYARRGEPIPERRVRTVHRKTQQATLASHRCGLGDAWYALSFAVRELGFDAGNTGRQRAILTRRLERARRRLEAVRRAEERFGHPDFQREGVVAEVA